MWKIDKGIEVRGRNLVNLGEIWSEKGGLKKLGGMAVEVLEREGEEEREEVEWIMKEEEAATVKRP